MPRETEHSSYIHTDTRLMWACTNNIFCKTLLEKRPAGIKSKAVLLTKEFKTLVSKTFDRVIKKKATHP